MEPQTKMQQIRTEMEAKQKELKEVEEQLQHHTVLTDSIDALKDNKDFMTMLSQGFCSTEARNMWLSAKYVVSDNVTEEDRLMCSRLLEASFTFPQWLGQQAGIKIQLEQRIYNLKEDIKEMKVDLDENLAG